MAELISYEELRKMQNAERDNKSIQEIDASFFDKVKEYIKMKKKLIAENKNKSNTFSNQAYEKAETELSNINRILGDLCARRQRKIVMQAITNIAARVHNTEYMLPEEEDMYNKIIAILKDKKENFFSKFDDSMEEQEELRKGSEELKLLRFAEDVPSFVWTDSKTYGPFSKEDVSNLPKDVGEILIKQGKAIEIVLGAE